jgi:hypothetical protein
LRKFGACLSPLSGKDCSGQIVEGKVTRFTGVEQGKKGDALALDSDEKRNTNPQRR